MRLAANPSHFSGGWKGVWLWDSLVCTASIMAAGLLPTTWFAPTATVMGRRCSLAA